MFKFFQRHDRNDQSKTKVPSTRKPPLTPTNNTAAGKSPAPQAFDAIRWALANPWLAEGQADDRTPMNGAVADGGGTAAEQRSLARRTHQLMFKKWSQARHD